MNTSVNIVALLQKSERNLRNHKKVVIQLKENIVMGLGIFEKKGQQDTYGWPYDSFNCLLLNVRQNNLLCGYINQTRCSHKLQTVRARERKF